MTKQTKTQQKTFTAPLRLKADGDPGEFQAVFATFNVEDLDGDVTLPGAFPEEQEVLVEPWNHDRTLPTGKGQIKSDETEAWVEGKFFLDTEAGSETYKTVKNLGPLAQWSYTFNIEDAAWGQHNGHEVYFLRKMDVVGVGPVNRGAGINTRTTAIKNEKPPKNDDKPNDEADEDSDGEAGDGKPSAGIGPQVVLTQIEIIEMEIEDAIRH